MLGIGPVAWVPPEEQIEHGDWIKVGRRLGDISRSNQWWLGDWMRYGTSRWGEKYAKAARVTGYDPRSLANMASVAAAFPPPRRRAQLSWSHHAAIVGLGSAEQDIWLDRALEDRLSVADLRIEVRSRRRDADKPEQDDDAEQGLTVVCPQCGDEISIKRSDLSPSK